MTPKDEALADLSVAIDKAFAAGATTEEVATRFAWAIVKDAVSESFKVGDADV